MKNSLKQKYLQTIAVNLDRSPWRDRFLSELSDHYNDHLEHQRFISGSAAPEAEVIAAMGKPEPLANNFNDHMRKMQFPFYKIELVLIAAAAMIVLYVLGLLSGFAQEAVLENIYHGSPVNAVVRQLWALALSPAASAGMALFYFVTVTRLKLPNVNAKTRKRFIIVLLCLPLMLVGLFSVFLLYQLITMFALPMTFPDTNNRALWLEILDTTVPLLKNLLIVLTSGRVINRLLTSPQNRAAWYKKIQMVTTIIFTACFGLLTYEMIARYVGAPLWWGGILLVPLEGLEFIFMILVTLAVGSWTNVLWVQWAMFGIYALISCLALMQVGLFIWKKFGHRQKVSQTGEVVRFPWLAALLAVYGIGTLFFAPLPANDLVEWHVPALAVSDQIEQQQLGVAYRFVKYFNQDEGNAFAYEINHGEATGESGEFVINQNSGQRFVLSNIRTLDNFRVTSKKMQKNTALNWSSAFKFTAAENMSAEDVMHDEKINCVLPDDYGDDGNFSNTPHPCLELYYEDKLIYKTNQWPAFSQMVISSDKTWALIHLINGYYDPSNVYLVKIN